MRTILFEFKRKKKATGETEGRSQQVTRGRGEMGKEKEQDMLSGLETKLLLLGKAQLLCRSIFRLF